MHLGTPPTIQPFDLSITVTKIGTFAPAGLEGPFQEKAIAEESAMQNEAGAWRWPMHLKEPI